MTSVVAGARHRTADRPTCRIADRVADTGVRIPTVDVEAIAGRGNEGEPSRREAVPFTAANSGDADSTGRPYRYLDPDRE